MNKGRIVLTMIKPNAVKKNNSGEILSMIEKAGFQISALKMTRLSQEKAKLFYSIHKEKAFFNKLVDFICSGPVIVAILLKNNAVKDFRNLIGATDPADAAEGTIRKLFAEDKTQNAIHGSDSDENAIIEAGFFFSAVERFL